MVGVLFLLCINEIPSSLKKIAHITMYEDDCIVYFTNNDINQFYSKSNSSLDQIIFGLIITI